MKLRIIDALGPFFVYVPSSKTVNWSKVAFSDIESDGRLSEPTRNQIITNFKQYLEKVSRLGYNAISIDDLAHMTELPFYSPETKLLIHDYRILYKRIFALAKRYDMKVYVNTDYLFTNAEIETRLESGAEAHELFGEMTSRAFEAYPEIAGIILRIGENDGKDVSGTFLSKLFIRTPKDANQLLRSILPIFEKHDKQLVFRTWTVGAYKIGDLIWNEHTYDKVFKSIASDSLIVSMKFGDTDFMRYLELNPLFMRGKLKKIIELQTRREWEGMGMLPSFVGWDYARYLNESRSNDTVVGAHIWCQTGGWAKREWTNLTFLKGSSFWNELNTEITASLLDGRSLKSAIETFCRHRGIKDTIKFMELLRLSDIAIKKGLYVNELASKTFYFRRTRIPPLLWLTWDKVHVPAAVIYLHRMLVTKNAAMIHDGEEALDACEEMLTIAKQLDLSQEVLDSIRFEKATLTIFNGIRKYIAGYMTEKTLGPFNRAVQQYTLQYPQHYTIDKLAFVKKRRLHRRLLSPFVRGSSAYRRRDRIFLKTSSVQARMLRTYLKRSKSHLANQSMGIETLFK